LNDLEALHDKEQSLKDCQFRLSLTAITILMIPGLNGVLAVFAAFSQGRGNGESYVLPPYFFDVTFLAQALLTLVSVLLLWIFSYKSDEIRRGGALIVLLQRYLVEDRFPPSYRGCQDVIENINYARDAGLAKDYEPNYRVPGVSRRYSNSRFALFGSLTLSFIPVASFLITLFCVLKENIDLQIFRMGELTWFHTALMIAVIIYQVAKKWKHDSGYRTVHYYVALFENFFEYSPPYNPRRSGPLPYGASNAAAGEMTAHP